MKNLKTGLQLGRHILFVLVLMGITFTCCRADHESAFKDSRTRRDTSHQWTAGCPDKYNEETWELLDVTNIQAHETRQNTTTPAPAPPVPAFYFCDPDTGGVCDIVVAQKSCCLLTSSFFREFYWQQCRTSCCGVSCNIDPAKIPPWSLEMCEEACGNHGCGNCMAADRNSRQYYQSTTGSSKFDECWCLRSEIAEQNQCNLVDRVDYFWNLNTSRLGGSDGNISCVTKCHENASNIKITCAHRADTPLDDGASYMVVDGRCILVYTEIPGNDYYNELYLLLAIPFFFCCFQYSTGCAMLMCNWRSLLLCMAAILRFIDMVSNFLFIQNSIALSKYGPSGGQLLFPVLFEGNTTILYWVGIGVSSVGVLLFAYDLRIYWYNQLYLVDDRCCFWGDYRLGKKKTTAAWAVFFLEELPMLAITSIYFYVVGFEKATTSSKVSLVLSILDLMVTISMLVVRWRSARAVHGDSNDDDEDEGKNTKRVTNVAFTTGNAVAMGLEVFEA